LHVAPVDVINSTLLQIKHVIKYSPDNFTLRADLPKNKKTLLKLGFMPSHVIDEICTLTYKNYHTGPEDNISRSGRPGGSIWVFGKEIEGIEIYIKFHLISTKRNTQCICISFHEADYPMTYPYKDHK